MAGIDLILAKLENVKPGNGGHVGRCPGHDDRAASLSIKQGNSGWPLLHCFAGCSRDAILEALGVRLSEVGPPRDYKATAPKLIATYDYFDETGVLLYQKQRFEPKTFRQRRPTPGGGWTHDLKDVRRVLYRLPEVLAAPVDAWIFLVEGEKAADRIVKLGLVATCGGGATAWLDSYAESLRGKHVVILPDNDKPGAHATLDVFMSLAGVAASVQVLPLDVAPKSDVYDWIETGGTAAQLTALAAGAGKAFARKIYDLSRHPTKGKQP